MSLYFIKEELDLFINSLSEICKCLDKCNIEKPEFLALINKLHLCAENFFAVNQIYFKDKSEFLKNIKIEELSFFEEINKIHDDYFSGTDVCNKKLVNFLKNWIIEYNNT